MNSLYKNHMLAKQNRSSRQAHCVAWWPIGLKKLQPRSYFCTFYSFELKLCTCRMVELCIPKHPVFCFAVLTVFGGKMTSQV